MLVHCIQTVKMKKSIISPDSKNIKHFGSPVKNKNDTIFGFFITILPSNCANCRKYIVELVASLT